MKNKLLVATSLLTMVLTACNNQTSTVQNWEKTISPAGAPAIAFYDQATTGKFETNATPSNVLAQLQADNYGMVVFDFYNGLKSLKTNEGHYKLARIITGGNLYLVGINKTTEPTADDYIVSFGKNLLPDVVYREIYGADIAEATHYVAGVSDAQGVLVSGLHEGNAVDYVLIAQPALFAAKQNAQAATFDNLTVISSLRDKWEAKTGQTAVPQAGLFINMNYYEGHRNYYEDQLALIDERIETAIEDPTTIKTTMDAQLTVDEQKTFFGFTSAIAYNVQKDDANGFALVSGDEEINIPEFFEAIGITEDYSNYIL